MKTKRVVPIIFIIAIALVISGAALFAFKGNDAVNDDKEKESSKKYNSLFELANEMYEDNSYLNLPKDSSNTYYMTIGEYKKRGYNLDLVDSSCPDNFDFIHFDVENKDEYENNPIYIFETCEIISGDNGNDIAE